MVYFINGKILIKSIVLNLAWKLCYFQINTIFRLNFDYFNPKVVQKLNIRKIVSHNKIFTNLCKTLPMKYT